MRPESYAALLVDLDGTVLGKDEEFTSRVGRAVRAASQHLRVSVATGRPPSEVAGYAARLGLTGLHICDGGATIYDPVQDRVVWNGPTLSADQTGTILARLREIKSQFIASYCGGDLTSEDQLPDLPFLRVTAMHVAKDQADWLLDYFAAVPGLEVVRMYLHSSGLWGVNFAPQGINKGNAARRLAELWDVEPVRFVAAGDSYNDLSLLEVCGLRIVMGNAPAELKALADYVAPTVDEDGLAVAIDEFLLPKLG